MLNHLIVSPSSHSLFLKVVCPITLSLFRPLIAICSRVADTTTVLFSQYRALKEEISLTRHWLLIGAHKDKALVQEKCRTIYDGPAK
jgi:hypothetical protein